VIEPDRQSGSGRCDLAVTILLGPYYGGNEGTAIYNSGFRPFQSPVPFLFVRHGVTGDWKFSWTTRGGSTCGHVATESPQFRRLLRNYAACGGGRRANRALPALVGPRITSEATEADRKRLQELKISLDQCWDLLRPRRALREAGRDPDAPGYDKAPANRGCESTSKPNAGLLCRSSRVRGSSATSGSLRGLPCGMRERLAVVCVPPDNGACQFGGLFYEGYGSDGTRTRDLRPDSSVRR
jgi:hypothetical protein